MDNPYENYYDEQVGSGISHFSGLQYQKGHGIGAFFGRLFKKIILPAAKYLGKKSLPAAKFLGNEAKKGALNLGSDILVGNNIKASAKRRFDELIENVENKIEQKNSEMTNQSGHGKRRRLNRKKQSSKRKVSKKIVRKRVYKRARKQKRTTFSKKKILSHLKTSLL